MRTHSQKDTAARDRDPVFVEVPGIAQSERIGMIFGRKRSVRLSRLKMAADLRGSSDKRKEGKCSTPSTSKSTDVSLIKSVAVVQTSGAEKGPSGPKQELERKRTSRATRTSAGLSETRAPPPM